MAFKPSLRVGIDDFPSLRLGWPFLDFEARQCWQLQICVNAREKVISSHKEFTQSPIKPPPQSRSPNSQPNSKTNLFEQAWSAQCLSHSRHTQRGNFSSLSVSVYLLANADLNFFISSTSKRTSKSLRKKCLRVSFLAMLINMKMLTLSWNEIRSSVQKQERMKTSKKSYF